ncbi:MAG: hypothetical protein OXQ28_07155 [Acidobacteriota bacterium]|nr:hypothetical protein [Acidobacteriota bacterium]
MSMTQQTFHVTELDPRATLCGRSGHVWAAPHWPSDEDMQSGMFTRCKDCDRLLTPALEAALDDARNLELTAINAYKAGWREGCGLPADAPCHTGTIAPDLVLQCRETGRRVGATAALAIRAAQSRGAAATSSNAAQTGPTAAPAE